MSFNVSLSGCRTDMGFSLIRLCGLPCSSLIRTAGRPSVLSCVSPCTVYVSHLMLLVHAVVCSTIILIHFVSLSTALNMFICHINLDFAIGLSVKRVIVTPAVYPRFLNFFTLTFRALGTHCHDLGHDSRMTSYPK